MKKELYIMPVIIGLSLILSTLIASFTYNNSRTGDTISVTGSAKKSVVSDTVKWNTGVMRTVRLDELRIGYANLGKDLLAVQDFLVRKGVKSSDIVISPISMEENWNNDGKYNNPGDKLYNLRQSITIQSKEVDKISDVAKSVNELAQKGVVMSTFSSIEYYYSKVSDLRVSLLSEAVKDAKARAEKILEPSGGTVGKMKTASSGVVQVLPKNSVEISDYGTYDTMSKEKEIMVTVRATFTIK
jgi:hypothetical protein